MKQILNQVSETKISFSALLAADIVWYHVSQRQEPSTNSTCGIGLLHRNLGNYILKNSYPWLGKGLELNPIVC